MAEAKPIVIVDEDEAVRMSTATLLRLLGHDVFAYASGEALLEASPAVDADCLLVDADLRGGVDAFALALARARRGELPPLILLADQADSGVIAIAARLGAADLIEKPYRTERLLDSISRARAPLAPDAPELAPAAPPVSRDAASTPPAKAAKAVVTTTIRAS